MKKYAPKKKKYNDLATLAREMIDSRVRMIYDGIRITTSKQIFTLFDGELLIRDKDGND